MPFNAFLDDYGDGAWTDLEASDSEGSAHDSRSSDSPSPRLHAHIIELCSEGSDEEGATQGIPDISPDNRRVVSRRLEADKEDEEPVDSGFLSKSVREQFRDPEHMNLLSGFMKDPTGGDKNHGSLQAERRELEPADSTGTDGRRDVATNSEAIDLNCERCLSPPVADVRYRKGEDVTGLQPVLRAHNSI
ncbi:hypothetical protein A1O7_02468 [Cladophialophora yegresii CBS 114405]|uniref:Uncharacterized protein n=1 Tax=Cladophialophora yegresii CBS 114405 TaxID=1182544 RepID=W9WAM3_9EURO|nr:uncharacterized protein A1O7_02468 [Cladophialophora yegresii CBS 114405]EXJ62035.1 hypothetical protein A1O7_02468 [Cladophialophora yegresii CBS 114405]